MFQLEKLSPLVKKRKDIGRGGKRGGTSGKGHKGQKARSGGSPRLGFEGGQMPLHRRLPKRGFTNAPFKKMVEIVDLSCLESLFSAGETVTRDLLIEKGVLKSKKSKRASHESSFKLKVLADGKLNKKLIVYADAFSQNALQAIQAVGGEAHVVKGE
jgi:large subunit ribosomal protein L15